MITPFDAVFIAQRFLDENIRQYVEFTQIDYRETEDMYIKIYKAKDYYDREVHITVIMDLIRKEIMAEVLLVKDDLTNYM